jgi:hypothetical protein
MSLRSSFSLKTKKNKKIEMLSKIKKILSYYLIVQLSLSSAEASTLSYFEKNKNDQIEH